MTDVETANSNDFEALQANETNEEELAFLDSKRSEISQVADWAIEEGKKLDADAQEAIEAQEPGSPDAATMSVITQEIAGILNKPNQDRNRSDFIRLKTLEYQKEHLLDPLKERFREIDKEIAQRGRELESLENTMLGRGRDFDMVKPTLEQHRNLPSIKRHWQGLTNRHKIRDAESKEAEFIKIQQKIQEISDTFNAKAAEQQSINETIRTIANGSNDELRELTKTHYWEIPQVYNTIVDLEIARPAREKIGLAMREALSHVEGKIVDRYIETNVKPSVEKEMTREEVRFFTQEEFTRFLVKEEKIMLSDCLTSGVIIFLLLVKRALKQWELVKICH